MWKSDVRVLSLPPLWEVFLELFQNGRAAIHCFTVRIIIHIWVPAVRVWLP